MSSHDAPHKLSLRLRPIPNSYWATPLLIACEYPWSPFETSIQKLDKLPRRRLPAGLDATTITYHQFPIPDRSLPHKPTYFMRLVLDVLRENAEQGRVCAVHCRGGIGRTGLVIGCWLVESGIARDGEEALKIIEREWRTVEKCKRFPHSPETGPQFEFVRNFTSPKMVPVLV
ncbi:protein-tyrosine phosphatase-like protein [Suillus paluster]|uniref:protein-tyrosine phosphatase-like protein n=1 Tax=Suillus paluster TaxID=48578 RepID=UPI001B867A02|nr:protein-tyrosine phosphatase-like protein [Suillus paluster]KAG1730399.1 protein-tyrosine phosphatase-like protein [Suillus paluster]